MGTPTSTRDPTPLGSKPAAELEASSLSNTEQGPPEHMDTKEPKSSPSDAAKSPEQPLSAVLVVVGSILLCLFVVTLDRTIVATAIPQITNEFNALTDVGWYGSAYLLTCCALQLAFGKLFTFFPVRYVLFSSVFLFELGSAICGASPNSIAFILGRAISGIGAAGIFTGAMTSVLHVISLKNRPKAFGAIGACMATAQITGPLIGGAFTTNVTWRWCFYINLPIGGIAMVAIVSLLRIPDQDTMKLPLMEKIKKLDLPGTALIAPGSVCILLALQWGGQTYAWNDARIIALITLGGVLMIAFAVWQVMFPETATLPTHFFKNRTVTAAFCMFIMVTCGNFIFIYFLPIWFQAITGVSASESGIRTIPMMAGVVVGNLVGGISTSKIGYYNPWAIFGSIVSAIGAGLLMTLQVDTSQAKWIGYQVMYGFGFGSMFQMPNLAIQAVLPKKDAPTGFSLCLFGGLLLSSVFLSVGENVLANELLDRLSSLPGFDASQVFHGGITSLLHSLPADLHDQAVYEYNEALRKVFMIGVIISCLAIPPAFLLEWKSIKGLKKFGGDEEEEKEEEKKAEEKKSQEA